MTDTTHTCNPAENIKRENGKSVYRLFIFPSLILFHVLFMTFHTYPISHRAQMPADTVLPNVTFPSKNQNYISGHRMP